MRQLVMLLFCALLTAFSSRASHVVGGDLTWTCQGGDYVFQLVFYRDCNGADINPVSETIRVWNHPTVTTISLPFVSRADISPICTEVAGGPSALECGTLAYGGNGLGAIEKIIYKSAPINLAGTPPAAGWIFTYENFSRNPTITNLQNPITKGITITAKMFAHSGSGAGCVDNSPVFLQDPYFVSCAGEVFEFNMNAVDPDLDSLAISFGQPLDHYSVYGPYNPPLNPSPIPFESGFTYQSPTPGVSMNPGNIPAQVNPSSGNLTFLTYNTGSFVVKIVAQSYRQGVLIAETEREMQLIVVACTGTNTKPNIVGPFGGLFETTVTAGSNVNFTLNASDPELLQNGTPQSNILTASALLFGVPYTNNTGCLITPCATLNTNPPITMVQGVSTTFNWDTSCDHLVNPYGYSAEMVPYHFVFKVQDDYCPVPKVSYATITINVLNPGVIPAPEINCIQTNAAGDLTISWTAATDPYGTFDSYELYSVQSGLIQSSSAIATTSFTVPGGGSAIADYYLALVSGCNGNTIRYSDTLKNIVLNLNNPSNGTAVLQWNDPATPAQSGMNGYYYLYREYPTGTWTIIDSIPYGVNAYIDTIDICSAYLNYQLSLSDQICAHTSSIDGDNLEDMMTPAIPNLASVSIDTLTGLVQLSWDVNSQPDTYGYVVYMLDANGIPVEIDTVWGINNTTYTHNTNTDSGPLSYTVAAFDSCWTIVIPPTYQTSAKAPVHTSIFLRNSLNICQQQVTLNWSAYGGWSGVQTYRIYSRKNGASWQLEGSTTALSYSVTTDQQETYCFVVEAVHADGRTSFSNITCVYIAIPTPPAFSYVSVATVDQNNIEVKYLCDPTGGVTQALLYRKEGNAAYEQLIQLSLSGGQFTYIDTAVDVDHLSYTYLVRYIDSCGKPGFPSNEAQTILLRASLDELEKLSYLNWNPYREFNGSILNYNLYRAIDSVFTPIPMEFLNNGTYSFQDNLSEVVTTTGKVCYQVEAVESMNIYGFSEKSRSNTVCIIFEPIIYIPNAFMPEGINSVFLPVVSDFNFETYTLTIFSRWGQTLFRTDNYQEGWNGHIMGNDEMAANDTYLYIVELRDGNGVQHVRRGHVTLIR